MPNFNILKLVYPVTAPFREFVSHPIVFHIKLLTGCFDGTKILQILYILHYIQFK